MRGDFSRIRLSRGKGYTAVLEQQGRVALDADANEQRFLDGELRRAQTADIVGEFGGPAGDEGFTIDTSTGDIVIGAGRYYVAGLLCENPAPVSYEAQPFLTVAAGTSATLLQQLSQGQTVVQVYLQAWQRLVTALDDPCLREPALGQADTTARLQTAWRVVARPVQLDVQKTPGPFCPLMDGDPPATSTGTLTVTTAAGTDCGCEPVAAAGYQGIENQLYRVEVVDGGDESGATFKWSRENGSVVAAVTGVTGATVQVDSLGPDANLGFEAGQWVELSDDTLTFGLVPNTPGTLYQIQATDKDSLTVTLTAPVTGIDPARNARMRRWDQSGPSATPTGLPLPAAPAVTALENGIQVSFGPGSYQAGDYWTFPARTATGTVEWPPCGSDGQAAQPPTSVVVHEAPLACLYWVPAFSPHQQPAPSRGRQLPLGHVASEDCRRPFRPLTAAPAVHVRSLSWRNDDVLPVDLLAVQGLVVTLDQALAGPVDGGSFIVTLEAVPEQYAKESTGAALRSAYILDSAVTAAGRQLTWQLPASPTLDYLQALLTQGTEIGRPVRVRVRLAGQALYADGASGLIYLDGRAFGQPGTRADGSTPRTDLRLPSGDGSLASDLESWFYLAPPLAVTSLAFAGGADYTAVGQGSAFAGVVPTGSTGVTPVTGVEATAALSYPAAAGGSLSVSLFTVSTAVTTPIASVPATVAIAPGQQTVTIPVTFSGAPAAGTVGSFTLSTTVIPAAPAFAGSEQAATAALTLRPAALPPSQPPPPGPAGPPAPVTPVAPAGPAAPAPAQ